MSRGVLGAGSGTRRNWRRHLRVEGSLDNVFFSGKGRAYDAGWVRTPFSAGNLIENPISVIESLFRDVLSVTAINTSSFDSVAVNQRTGWEFARSLLEKENSPDIVQGLAEESGVVSFCDSSNNQTVRSVDYAAPLIGLTSADIAESNGAPLVRCLQSPLEAVRNEFYLSYKWNYATGAFAKSLFITASTDNLADNTRDNTDGLGATYQALCSGSQTRYNKTEKLTFEANWIRDDATAELFIKFLANWLTYRKWVVQATLRYTAQALALELMDPISWTLDLLPDAVQTDNAFLVTRLVDGGLAQRGLIEIEAMQVPSFFGLNAAKAVALDGSSERAVKTSPSNIDMSGAETITDTDDRDFETDVGTWVASAGNHSISRTTSNPLAGTGSGLIAATGAGSQGLGHAYLPTASFTTLVSGKKYTIQLLANSDTATTTITLALGPSGQTKTSGTLSTTPGTGTLVVWNFTAGAADVSQTLRVFANKAANVRIDSISITVAKHAVIHHWFKSASATQQRITSTFGSGGTAWYTELAANGTLIGSVTSSTGNQSAATSANGQGDDAWRLASLVLNRTTNLMQWHVNGVASGSAVDISGLGKINGLTSLYIGWNTGSAYFNGSLGEIQVIIDGAMTTAEILAYYNTGIKRIPPGGTVVAHYRWRGTTETEWLKDETGNNNLTGTNLARASDQVAGTYAIFEG